MFKLTKRCFLCNFNCHSYKSYRYYNNSESNSNFAKSRNIGILAHIDAGKTTTTERMLFYSGKIKMMGEVHRGNTVTDYMEQERNRGITITSACVTFMWNEHTINLVDTPGHIDFTVEVEQALNVIDSAVVVLDGTAGVEVQTTTVWRQADDKNLPRLVYVNKMDRPDSDIELCEKSLKEKLAITPLMLHLPIKSNTSFDTIVDLVTLTMYKWTDGKISGRPLSKSDDVYPIAIEKRNELIDLSSTFDDRLAEIVLDKGSFDSINEKELQDSIRKITIARQAVPIICGSSYKNVGVETLLDGIVSYLPSQMDAIDASVHNLLKEEFIAKSFKVMHDKQRGPLVFLRIYNGKVVKGQKVYDFHQEKNDQVSNIYKPFADELTEVSAGKIGDFVAVGGLKIVQNGDIVCNSATAAKHLKDAISKSNTAVNFLQPNRIPKPVFFCSIEPPSRSYQLPFERALAELSREDPSLKVTYDDENGQTILGGMGELHLEIIKDRILTQYKIDADIGPLQIVYKEKPLNDVKETHNLKNLIGSNENQVDITLSLKVGRYDDLLRLDNSKEAAQNLAHLHHRQLAAIRQGIRAAFSRGPLMSCEVIDTHIVLHHLQTKKRVPEPLLIAATAQCVAKLLNQSGTQLLEPIMDVTIIVDDSYLKTIQVDLSRRRADITNVISKYNAKEITCEVPLSELLGYAKHLRTITSGSARFTMEYKCYREMLPMEQEQILSNLL